MLAWWCSRSKKKQQRYDHASTAGKGVLNGSARRSAHPAAAFRKLTRPFPVQYPACRSVGQDEGPQLRGEQSNEQALRPQVLPRPAGRAGRVRESAGYRCRGCKLTSTGQGRTGRQGVGCEHASQAALPQSLGVLKPAPQPAVPVPPTKPGALGQAIGRHSPGAQLAREHEGQHRSEQQG